MLNSAAVVQPGIEVEAPFGLSLSAWGSMDMTDKYDLRNRFQEVDLEAFVALPIDGPLSLSVGVINYLFPQESAETTEVILVIEGDVPLQPMLEVAYDADQVLGFYANLGISHGITLCERSELEFAASLGWAEKDYNDAYFAVEKSTFNDVNVGITYAYALWDNLETALSVNYTRLIDSAIGKAAEEEYGYKQHLYAGLGLSWSF